MSGRLLRSSNVLCVALAATVLVGCLSVRPLDPAAGPVRLAEGVGILVLHVETDFRLDAVHASEATLAEDLSAGEHLLLLAAPAGAYTWHRLERKLGAWTYLYRFPLDGDRSRFTVEAGKINYPGQLVVVRPDPVHAHGIAFRDERLLALRIVNRSATLVELLLERHADLVERFPMRYSGWGRDAFLERYLEARHRLSEATDGEPSAP